jgi:hypothetical protein
MTIFDRSWYGRVLVERVENLANEAQWRRAYDEISDFEHSLAEEGMVVIKLWLHMSHEEQLRRFERRRDDPLKSWKLTAEDWRNREKRPQYDEAVSDMLRLTSGRLAPWDVISAENKRNGRVEVIETVIRRMEEGMARWGIEVPSADDEEEERTQAALAFDDAEFQPDPEVEAPAEAPGPVAAGAPVAATVPAAPAPAPAAAPAPVPAAAPAASPAAAPVAAPVASPVASPVAAPAAAGANGNYAASPAPSPAPAPAPPATTPRTRLDG